MAHQLAVPHQTAITPTMGPVGTQSLPPSLAYNSNIADDTDFPVHYVDVSGVEVSCEQTFIFLPQVVQYSSSRSMSQERLNSKSLLEIERDHSDSLDLEGQSYLRSSFDITERILHLLPSKDN